MYQFVSVSKLSTLNGPGRRAIDGTAAVYILPRKRMIVPGRMRTRSSRGSARAVWVMRANGVGLGKTSDISCAYASCVNTICVSGLLAG